MAVKFIHVEYIIYSFSVLCSVPLCDYTTIHVYIILLMDMSTVPSWGAVMKEPLALHV